MTALVHLTKPFVDDITLDSTGLIATVAGSGSGRAETPTINIAGTSKSYGEFTCNDPANNPGFYFQTIGTGTVDQAYSVIPGFNGSKLTVYEPSAYFVDLGVVWVNTGTLCVAYDAGTGKIWFKVDTGYWNGSPTDDPATGSSTLNINPGRGGGTVDGNPYAYLAVNSFSSMTASFGKVYRYTPPTGFMGWDGLDNGGVPPVAGSASGHAAVNGVSAVGQGRSGLANGASASSGTSGATVTFSGSASGRANVNGVAVGGQIRSGAAGGYASVLGLVTQTVAVSGSASGSSGMVGVINSVAVVSGSASGRASVAGSASYTTSGLATSYSSASVQMLG